MANYSDMLRGFTQFMDEIEREMYQAKEGVCLPDEIDLYNFFEMWGGRAECKMLDHSKTIYSICDYSQFYDYATNIRYHIGKAKYYALRFNGRGTFLVSEKRYNELKAKKGK
jgi:hypothetical protein